MSLERNRSLSAGMRLVSSAGTGLQQANTVLTRTLLHWLKQETPVTCTSLVVATGRLVERPGLVRR